MTAEIATVLIIILAAVVLFVTDKLRVDLVALLVLVSLVITNLVSPAEALSGFSNPAVITVWAMFILSGGLTVAGVANRIGAGVMKYAGSGEVRLMLMIMLTAAVLSAFMNNVGVAALLLPVVIVISRKTNIPPSRLLLPLAYGALLGGLMTLIGTPPNILASDALRDAGFPPFKMFDFLPVGLAVLLAGILFMVVIGRRLMPSRDPTREITAAEDYDLEELYDIRDRLMIINIPPNANIVGMSLEESQVGQTLGLNVIAIVHDGHTLLSPGSDSRISEGDQLLAIGRPDQLNYLRRHQVKVLERANFTTDRIENLGLRVSRFTPQSGSKYIGKMIEKSQLRDDYGLNVLAVRHGEEFVRSELATVQLKEGDCLLLQGTLENMDQFAESEGIELEMAKQEILDQLHEMLLYVVIPSHSALAGQTLVDSQLGHAFGLTVLSIERGEWRLVLPEPEEQLVAGDRLLIQGTTENITALRGLEQLEIDTSKPVLDKLETESIGLLEVVLSPHTTLVGKTLNQLLFRDKYGLNVLAIWRGGHAYTTHLRDFALRFGDALLLYGTREKMRIFGSETDFIALSEEVQEPIRPQKAPLAVLIMAGVLLSVVLGWLPIAIAGVLGGALMVLTGVMTMDEAYRYIEWPAVFLIAGMLPLGIAMQNSGAAQFIADGMMDLVGNYGTAAILAGLFVMSVLASQVMPNAAVVVLMAPIAFAAATDTGASPQSLLMGIAIAASASFMSPVSHPANILVMGPGGYKFSDYIKVGLPLTVVVFIVVMIVLPIVWPF